MTNFNQNHRWLLIASIILGLFVVISGVYWILKWAREPAPQTALPKMANLPARTEPTKPPPPSYPPDAPVLEQVRNALREGINATEAVAMANSLPDRPERADAAFLLLEYAAESGNVDAALAVGCYYDPSFSGPSGSIRKNPVTAYEWYQRALPGRQQKAQEQLARLRRWIEEKADQGSGQAKELLARWR